MKTTKFIIAAIALVALLSSCRSKPCPGYGELRNDIQQTEQQA